MRRLVSIISVLTLTAAISAQAPPSFSGAWALESSRGAVPAAGGGGGAAGGGGGASARPATGGGGGAAVMAGGGGAAMTLEIAQTAGTLTMTRGSGESAQTRVYKLDGSESVNTFGSATSRTRSRWEGRKLVTEGTQSVATSQGDISSTFREVIELDEAGKLHVETSRERNGEPMAPSRQVYARK